MPADVESEIREEFIRAKYVNRSWIPHDSVENQESLGEELCRNVATDNLMETIKFIALGADVSSAL